MENKYFGMSKQFPLEFRSKSHCCASIYGNSLLWRPESLPGPVGWCRAPLVPVVAFAQLFGSCVSVSVRRLMLREAA